MVEQLSKTESLPLAEVKDLFGMVTLGAAKGIFTFLRLSWSGMVVDNFCNLFRCIILFLLELELR